LVQGPSTDLEYNFVSTGDTTIFVESVNSGFGCDLAKATIVIEGLIPSTAYFDVSSTTQSFFDPTFSFYNSSENATDFVWDLGECKPQLNYWELFASPTFSYNPTDENIFNYTYGCAPGNYTVQLIASNLGYCADTFTQVIKIEPNLSIYVPNTFTPDFNSYNQLFFPVFNDDVVESFGYVFRIYNRWGDVVFETKEMPEIPTLPSNKKGAWDGISQLSRDVAQDGTYTWEVYYKVRNDDEVKKAMGHVNLIR
jgi:hypothetical protein